MISNMCIAVCAALVASLFAIGTPPVAAARPSGGTFDEVSLVNTNWCLGFATYSYSWSNVQGRATVLAWSHVDGDRTGPWAAPVSTNGSESMHIEWGAPGTHVPTNLRIEFELTKGRPSSVLKKVSQGKSLDIIDSAWTATISCGD